MILKRRSLVRWRIFFRVLAGFAALTSTIAPAVLIGIEGICWSGALLTRHLAPSGTFVPICFEKKDALPLITLLGLTAAMPAVTMGIFFARGPITGNRKNWTEIWDERRHHALWFYGTYLPRTIGLRR